jgi:hypothetical protein
MVGDELSAGRGDGPRPEDTDVDAWWVAKSAGVRVLPVELEGTRSPAIYADVRSARFAAGADWSRSLDALVRALA